MSKKLMLIFLLLISFLTAQPSVYVLCEGNFNSLNASLWSINSDHSAINGPIYWNPAVNPLGDTGQSLKIHNDRLYIVMNNSNTIEIADISDGFQYENTIQVPFAGPRDIEIIDNIAYISCWYLNGILLLDLSTQSFIDTLMVNGLPEDLLYYNDKLYASITMNSDWTSSDKVIAIDVSGADPVITETFTVISGPGQLLGNQSDLYVASTYYDTDWNTYAGNSKINLQTGQVSKMDFGINFQFGADLTLLNDKVYRVYNGGACPVTDYLTMDTLNQIAHYSNIYSMASNNNLLYFGLSDYVAPDNITIVDLNGTELANFQVGACPGSFVFYNDNSNSISSKNELQKPIFILNQNFPNPFNGTTTISYTISEPGSYSLSIYNMTGQHIINLTNSYHVTGNVSAVWNGFDKNGLAVPNGIYYYQLHSNRGTISKKMLYLK